MSADIRQELTQRVTSLTTNGIVPTLAGVLVGDDPGSASYVHLKEKAATEFCVRA